MERISFRFLLDEAAAAAWLRDGSSEECRLVAQQANGEQLASFLRYVDLFWEQGGKKKWALFTQALEGRKRWEQLADQLSWRQWSQLLKPSEPIQESCLEALFVGLSPTRFAAWIEQNSSVELQLLKGYLHLEPLLHQLTLFSHGAEKKLEGLLLESERLAQAIVLAHPMALSLEEFDLMQSELAKLSEALEAFVRQMDKGLLLAWATHRTELIDRYGQLKEQGMRLCLFVIGSSRSFDGSMGLSKLLRDQLNGIYGESASSSSLADEDPAVEALAKLGVWYPEQLAALGLLDEPLDASALASDKERWTKVQEKLAEYGLITVGDFKQAAIFSGEGLKRYLMQWNG